VVSGLVPPNDKNGELIFVPTVVTSNLATPADILVNTLTSPPAYFYIDGTKLFNVTISNVKSYAIANYPIANFTSSCVDSAKQLSYGAQCIAWKRDALGLPIGMSGGLSFDGGKSVKPIETQFMFDASQDFAFAITIEIKSILAGSNGFNTAGSRIGVGTVDSKYALFSTGGNAYSGVKQTGFYRLSIKYTASTKALAFYANGVKHGGDISESTIVSATKKFMVGAEATTTYSVAMSSMASYPRLFVGSNAVKFDPVKDYQISLKYVAKLGA